jgi:ABC-type spermidine/putrescine transport system permease subunit I
MRSRQAGENYYWYLGPSLAVLAVFFGLPLVITVIRSFGGGYFDFSPYVRFFGDSFYLTVLVETLLLSAGIAAAVVVLGFPFALAIARSEGMLKSFLTFMILVPLLTNAVVRSFGWLILIGGNGLLNQALAAAGFHRLRVLYTWTAVIIGLFHVMLPFGVLSMASVISKIDRRLEEAARTLGANSLQVMKDVTIPNAAPGLAASAALVFSLTSGSYVTVIMLGGSGQHIVSTLIYQQVAVVGDIRFGSAMGVILLISVIFTLYLKALFFVGRRK